MKGHQRFLRLSHDSLSVKKVVILLFVEICKFEELGLCVCICGRVATCKPGKPGLTSFSETLALFFIQFLSFRKMKVQDRHNVNPGLPEKNWLTTRLICTLFFSYTRVYHRV